MGDLMNEKAILINTNEESNAHFPLVSVIIPTFNSARHIVSCIESLMNQEYPNIDIILVDNFSSDQTCNLVENFKANVLKVKALRAEARNIGASVSKGDYLLHIDSDMILNPKIVCECVVKCEKEGYDALIIPEISIGDGYLAGCRSLQKKITENEQGYESVRFLRASTFASVGGYDEQLEAGEDFDLHFRVEAVAKISRITSSIKHNEGRLLLNEIVSKYKHYGQTISTYSEKNCLIVKQQKSLIEIYIEKPHIIINNIKFTFGLLIMELLEFVLIGYKSRRVADLSCKKME